MKSISTINPAASMENTECLIVELCIDLKSECVACITTLHFHLHLVTFQAKNSVRSTLASIALSQVSTEAIIHVPHKSLFKW